MAILRSEFEVRSSAETAAYLRMVARNCLMMLRRKQRAVPPTVDLEAAAAQRFLGKFARQGPADDGQPEY